MLRAYMQHGTKRIDDGSRSVSRKKTKKQEKGNFGEQY